MPDNVDLDTVTVSGMYRLAGMEPTWQMYSQMLVVHGGADTISQIIFAFLGGGVYVRTGNPSQVGGPGAWRDWKQLAACTVPEVHELSLVNGATAEKSCVYYKTQENLVIGQLDLQTSAAAYQEVVVADLPEGFRPSRDTPFIVSSCARKGVVWEGTGWGRISPDGYIFIYQNIAWGWAQAQFSFVAAD